MNNNTINLGCCPICFSPYNHTDHDPRIVPLCGHSLCLSCLNTIMAEDQQVFRCPICLRRVKFAKVELNCFPKNYSLLDLTEKLNTHEFCGTHHSQLELVCLQCKVKVCGKCVFRGEHKTHDVDVIEDYMRETGDRAKDLISWIESFDGVYRISEKIFKSQENDVISLVNSSFEKFIKGVLEKQKRVVEEIRNSFRKMKTVSDDESAIEIEHCSTDIFEWKERLKTIILKWEENKSLISALDIHENDSGISKELRRWIDPHSKSKIYSSLKDIPKKLSPILDAVKPYDEKIHEAMQNLFSPSYKSIEVDMESENLKIIPRDNRLQIIEYLKPEKQCISNYYLDDQNFGHHYVDKIQQIIFSNSNVAGFSLSTSKDFLDLERSKIIFSGLSAMPSLTNISIELTDDKNLCDQIIEDIALSIQSQVNLQKICISITDGSKISDKSFTRLFRSLCSSRLLQNIDIEVLKSTGLGDEGLQALGTSISSLINLKVFSISFSDARSPADNGFIPFASSIKRLSNLESLHISIINSTISDESLKHFSLHLEHLKRLREVNFNLKGSSDISNAGISNFSASLNLIPDLKNLSIDFEGTRHLNDKGFSSLMEHISNCSCLESLWLSFDRCFLLKDIGFYQIEERFKSLNRITNLTLSFRECSIISDEGLIPLTKAISSLTSLKYLTLNLASLSKVTLESFNELANAIKVLRELKSLELDFENCCGSSDESLTVILESLPQEVLLEKFMLNLKDCTDIGNNIFKTLGNILSRFDTMKSLHLDVSNCSKISDGGISSFTIFLPGIQNLSYLVLKLNNIPKLTDDGISQLAQSLDQLVKLEVLKLDLMNSKQITIESINSIRQNLNKMNPANLIIEY